MQHTRPEDLHRHMNRNNEEPDYKVNFLFKNVYWGFQIKSIFNIKDKLMDKKKFFPELSIQV